MDSSAVRFVRIKVKKEITEFSTDLKVVIGNQENWNKKTDINVSNFNLCDRLATNV